MFKPKITKGPWHKGWVCGALRHIEKNVYSDCFIDPKDIGEDYNYPRYCVGDDAGAICAVPELLEVLKAARDVPEVFEKVISVHSDGSKTVSLSKYPELQEAIKKLDETHCSC